jgi:hypothetical protein
MFIRNYVMFLLGILFFINYATYMFCVYYTLNDLPQKAIGAHLLPKSHVLLKIGEHDSSMIVASRVNFHVGHSPTRL